MIKLSVIIPAHNEEIRIVKTVNDVDSYLKKQNYTYEIIVVDSWSNDGTFEVVKKLVSEGAANNLQVIRQDIHGKGAAVKLGVARSQGQYVMFMDADNATPISEVEKFWPYLEQGYEVVIGDRYLDEKHKAHQPWYRTLLSRGSNLLIQIVLIPHVHDTQAGFKCFNGNAARNIFKHITINRFAFDMELLVIALKFSYRIKAVPIIRDQEGGSTVPPTAFIQSLADLFKIKWNSITGRYNVK
jgi:dolichyl-phosphate beta-glucosyltransferase